MRRCQISDLTKAVVATACTDPSAAKPRCKNLSGYVVPISEAASVALHDVSRQSRFSAGRFDMLTAVDAELFCNPSEVVSDIVRHVLGATEKPRVRNLFLLGRVVLVTGFAPTQWRHRTCARDVSRASVTLIIHTIFSVQPLRAKGPPMCFRCTFVHLNHMR